MIRLIKKTFNIKTDILFVRMATIAAHIGVVYSFFIFDSAWLFASAIGMALIVSIFMDVGYHRYYSHRAFKASRLFEICLLYTSPSPRDRQKYRMPSSA